MQVAAEAGVTPDELVRRIQAEVGSSVTVQSGTEQATEDSDEVATFTTIIRYFLLTFAGIALFVGAFVIFNTLSITVAQRTREFATLRTVGASRRQVLGSVIVEALVIGLLASVLGLFAGLGLAIGLNELFVALNLDLPQTDTVFATRTIVVSLLVGTLVTLAAGLSPALRATRVPPIAAVREGAHLPRVGAVAPLDEDRGRDGRDRGGSRSPTRCSRTASRRARASCCSASACSRCSSGSRCSRRASSSRSPASSGCPRAGWAARPASSPRATRCATPGAPPPPRPR